MYDLPARPPHGRQPAEALDRGLILLSFFTKVEFDDARETEFVRRDGMIMFQSMVSMLSRQ